MIAANASRLRRWTPAAAAVGLVLAGVFVTSDAWLDMARIAMRDEESSQILLVPVIAALMVWVRRRRLRHCRPVGQWIGPVIALLGAAIYVLGDMRLIQSFWHGGAVLVCVGCALTILGTDVLRNFFPVFLVLVFLVPVPGRIRYRVATPMQTATASVTQETCDVLGLPVDRSGNLLRFQGVDVAIGEACNGMRMTFALMLVSAAFAFTTPLRGYVRLLIIVLSPLSAVLCNVIRLIPTVWVFGNCERPTAEWFHDISGWVMLFFAFLLLMGVIRLLRWITVPVSPFVLAQQP
jgi:exosortase